MSEFSMAYEYDKARGECWMAEYMVWAWDILRGTVFSTYQPGLLLKWIKKSIDTAKRVEWVLEEPPENFVLASRIMFRRMTKDLLGKAMVVPVLDKYAARSYYYHTLHGKSAHVLDFGAGWGREVLTWFALSDKLTYVAMDAIEGPYRVQADVLRWLTEVDEYIEGYTVDFEKAKSEALACLHVPTWRFDLVPDHFFDLIMCNNSLSEVEEELVSPLLEQFRRVLMPGGRLLLEDWENWKPVYELDVPELLAQTGWKKTSHVEMGKKGKYIYSGRTWIQEEVQNVEDRV